MNTSKTAAGWLKKAEKPGKKQKSKDLWVLAF
jgi:hypothetical protein